MMKKKPLISCLCITRDRILMLKQAIALFHKQTYLHKELVILYEHDDLETGEFIETIGQCKKLRLSEVKENCWTCTTLEDKTASILVLEVKAIGKKNLGTLRNLSIKFCQGDYVCQWDDDDWYREDRLSVQMQYLQKFQKSACVLSQWFMYDLVTSKAYLSCHRPIGWEGSLLCERSQMVEYADLAKAEDTIVLKTLLEQDKLALLDRPDIYVYVRHQRNTWEQSHFDFLVSLAEELPQDMAISFRQQYLTDSQS